MFSLLSQLSYVTEILSLYNYTYYPHSCPQMAGQIDMNRQSDLMAAFEEQCGK